MHAPEHGGVWKVCEEMSVVEWKEGRTDRHVGELKLLCLELCR
jgi:hypothetical protein